MQIQADLVEQFTRELTAVGGTVYQSADVTGEVIQFLKSRDIHKIHLEPDVLDQALLQREGIAFTHEPDPTILAGVTKAVCGLADTGSILVADGPGSPLHASLLPQIHLAVLSRADVLSTMPDAMQLVNEKDRAVFITGPSRTADIEMTLTIGVHGPGELLVFLAG